MPFIVFLVAVESSSHTSHSLLELAEISTGRGIGIPNPSFDKTVLHFEDLHFQYHRPPKGPNKIVLDCTRGSRYHESYPGIW